MADRWQPSDNRRYRLVIIGVSVEGARTLRSSLKNAAGDLNDLKALHKKVAAEVLPFALAMTPKDDGDLVSSGRSSGTATTAYLRFGNKRTPYAGATHYGFPTTFRDRINRSHNQKPHPWLLDAVHDSEPFWIEIYWDGINEIINNISGD